MVGHDRAAFHTRNIQRYRTSWIYAQAHSPSNRIDFRFMDGWINRDQRAALPYWWCSVALLSPFICVCTDSITCNPSWNLGYCCGFRHTPTAINGAEYSNWPTVKAFCFLSTQFVFVFSLFFLFNGTIRHQFPFISLPFLPILTLPLPTETIEG